MKFEQKDIPDNIDRLIKHAIPFALYRLPQQERITLIVQDVSDTLCLRSIEDLNTKKGFVIAPFHITDQHPLVLIKPDKQMSLDQLTTKQVDEWVSKWKSPFGEKGEKTLTNMQDYEKTFKVFSDTLKQKTFEKLVLSRSYNYPKPPDLSMGEIFLKACERYPFAYVCLSYTSTTGLWFGCSPELLLSNNGRKCKTVALAGSKKQDDDLDWDEKNRIEQEIVSTYMRQQLSLLHFIEKKTEDAHAGNLVHLKTEFEFEQANTSYLGSLLDQLHPTPAVCGFPKKETYRFILDNENYDRSYYSGFWGFIDPDAGSNLYVNIRCMQVKSEHIRIFAGGGLLASSDMSTEWKETEEKLQTMLNLIQT